MLSAEFGDGAIYSNLETKSDPVTYRRHSSTLEHALTQNSEMTIVGVEDSPLEGLSLRGMQGRAFRHHYDIFYNNCYNITNTIDLVDYFIRIKLRN